jgi:hypothetical protein
MPDPEPLPAVRRSLYRWAGPAFSVAIILALLASVVRLHVADIEAMVPTNPVFWMVFAACYLALPTSEWLIYRRLWRIPPLGLLPLLRKRVSNEVLFGYSGELYLYVWSRRHAQLVAAPFGTIKDVAILSAVVGNLFTLALVAISYPFVGSVGLGAYGHDMFAAVAILLLGSLAAMALRGRVFSLPRGDRRFIAAVHVARLIVTTTLTAMMWHLVLPDVALRWWLVLAALYMVVGRLPLIANKDLVFAGIALMLVGRQAAMADLLAMMAVLIMGAHIAVALLVAAVPDRVAEQGAR